MIIRNIYGEVLTEVESIKNLHGKNLTKADLSGADLFEANLNRTDLSWADLSGADLCGSNLYKANLTGANLFGANLYKANLSGAKGIIHIQMPQHDMWAQKNMCKIGCYYLSYDKWENCYLDIGKKNNYSAEEIEMYHQAILFCKGVMSK